MTINLKCRTADWQCRPAALRLTVAVLLFVAQGPAAGATGFFDSPVGQAFASLVIPGSGQLIQGNRADGMLQLGLFSGAALLALDNAQADDLLGDDRHIDDQQRIIVYNDSTLKRDIYATLLTDTAFYSAFGAYRDARRGTPADEYRTPAPRENFNDLAVAPFRWEYLRRPTTWIPLALTVVSLASAEDETYAVQYTDDVNRDELNLYYSFGIGFGPAIGEEAFFRGFLNNELSHRYSPTTGLALSSVLFGLGHAGRGNQANALSATLAGAYLGWLQQRNAYSIGEGVALHFWLNFLQGVAALEQGGSANLVQLRIEF